MSLAHRTRAEADSSSEFYPTPFGLCQASVAALVRDKLIDLDFGPALEPSCGTGNWIRALGESGYRKPVHAVDMFEHDLGDAVVSSVPSLSVQRVNFLEQTKATLLGPEEDYADGGFGLILGNPPFSNMSDHVRKALSLLRPDGVLAFITRMGWFTGELERDRATPRRDWLWGPAGAGCATGVATPSRMYLVMPRPSFTGHGNDAATYVLSVWVRPWDAREQRTATEIHPLVWRERAQRGSRPSSPPLLSTLPHDSSR